MKRIEKRNNLTKNISPIFLFLDDLEYIYELAEKYNFKVKFSDQQFSYDNLDEVRQVRGNKTDNLRIDIYEESRWHSVDLNYNNGSVQINTWPTTDAQKIIWQNIVDHFSRTRNAVSKLIGLITFWPLFYLLCFLPAVIISKNETLKEWYIVLIALYSVLWLITLSVKRIFACVYLQRRHEVNSFWKRNSDKIILIVIGAIIGGCAKWIFDLFSNMLQNK
jgi:hypothetical protein